MPQSCDICGSILWEGQELVDDELPFARRRWYCPPCHARFDQRIVLFFLLAALSVALLGSAYAVVSHRPLLDTPWMWTALLILVHWLLIVPHELGHAIAARLVGISEIRILIGSGRPLGSFEGFGFRWLIHLTPLGGMTLANPSQNHGIRWRLIVLAAAGPAVSVFAAAASLAFIDRGAFFDGRGTWTELFFWANVIVVVENLFPHIIQGVDGRYESDGLALWNTLFAWNQARESAAKRNPRLRVALSRLLKLAIVTITGFAALLMAFLAVDILRSGGDSTRWTESLGIAAMLLVIMLLAVWVTFRIARRPIATRRDAPSEGPTWRAALEWNASSKWVSDASEARAYLKHKRAGRYDEALAQINSALERYPRDPQLLAFRFELLMQLQEFGEAERVLDGLIASVPGRGSATRALATIYKLHCVLQQGDSASAEESFLEFMGEERNVAETVELVDLLVCLSLYQDPPCHLQQLERWTRIVLDAAPRAWTLHGTLGGLLAEQGRFLEAQPPLHECLKRTPSLTERGFATLYLAIVAKGMGEYRKAGELFKQARILHADPWLMQKAERHLRDFDEQRAAD